MTNIILCDIDHTLIRPLGNRIFPDPKNFITDQEAINDWIIAKHPQSTFVGLSNQAGIEAGHCNIIEVIDRFKFTLSLIPRLDSIFFVPDFDGKSVIKVDRDFTIEYPANPGEYFRKPDVGAVHLVEDLYQGNIEHIYGDRIEDLKLAAKSNKPFTRITTSETQ